jgi:hypothetical protein
MLPKPELNCKVVNLMSGHGWVNNSFLLSRISRDLEATCKGRAQTGGLNIEVINAGKPGAVRNCPPSDRVNMGIYLAQLAICFATFFRNGDITPLILVVGATFILEGIATLPLWFVHNFSARTDGGKNLTYALMGGKGH